MDSNGNQNDPNFNFGDSNSPIKSVTEALETVEQSKQPQNFKYAEGRANSVIIITEDEMQYLKNRESKKSTALM